MLGSLLCADQPHLVVRVATVLCILTTLHSLWLCLLRQELSKPPIATAVLHILPSPSANSVSIPQGSLVYVLSIATYCR